jgi:hypothetical protein
MDEVTNTPGPVGPVPPVPQVRVVNRMGINLLPFFDEPQPVRPVTNSAWAGTLRQHARDLVWLLPTSAALYGLATVGGLGGTGWAAPVRLVTWVAALWVGLAALFALGWLLAASPTRRAATGGPLVALAGALLLPYAEVAGRTPVQGLAARPLALVGATLFSLGWLLAGWAVLRSRVFGAGDGVLLMLAAPMLGLGGLLLPLLHTIGALLVLAAGVGVAWKAGRLVPRARPTRVPVDG